MMWSDRPLRCWEIQLKLAAQEIFVCTENELVIVNTVFQHTKHHKHMDAATI